MATVVDLLRQLAHDRAPDRDILHGPLTLPPRQRSPYALDLPEGRGTVWSSAMGRATTSQHALGIMASRAGEGVAFVGGGTLPSEDALLVVLDHLRGAGATALWLVPDAAAAQRATALLGRLERRVELRWLLLADAPARPAFVQLIVATYDEMHARLLPFADRAWRWFWRGLRVIALPELDRTNGLTGAHLRWLVRRALRLAERPLALIGASAPLTEAGATFQSLLGRACRIVDSTVGPTEATLVMTWRCDERYQTLEDLTKTLRGRGLSLVVVGRDQRDDEVLRSRLGATNIATVEDGAKAAIALVSGVPADAGTRDALVRSGYRMVVMLVADDPHELAYADDLEQIIASSPALVVPDDNLFVTSFHLQAAAAELPLDVAEIDRWRVAERVETLVNKGRLRVLNDGALQPTDADLPPTLQAATSNETFMEVRDPRGSVIAALRPAVADWRGLPGATWASDLVVAHRDDEQSTVDLAVDERRRLAFATATYTLTPRTKIDQRDATIADHAATVTHRNVEVRQRVVGLEEHVVGRPPVSPRIAAPLDARWVAHGCAFSLAVAPDEPSSAGWSLKHALVMLTRCAFEDVIVTYDAPSRSLWLIETAPGSTGIADWTLAHLDDVLVAADTIARLCATNDLLRTLAERELAWLEATNNQRPTTEDRRPRTDHSADNVLSTIAVATEKPAPPARARVYAARPPSLHRNVTEQQVPVEVAARIEHQPVEERRGFQPADTPDEVVDDPQEVATHIEDTSEAEPSPEVMQPVVESAPVEEDDTAPVLDIETLPDAFEWPMMDAEQERIAQVRPDVPPAVTGNTPVITVAESTAPYDAHSDPYDEDVWNAPVVEAAPPAPVVDESSADQLQVVEDVTWTVTQPTADDDDVRWEAEPATQPSRDAEPLTQLPLDAEPLTQQPLDTEPAIPPLGRERPALNDGVPSRPERPLWRRSEPQRPPSRSSNEREAPPRQRAQSPAPRDEQRGRGSEQRQPSRPATPPPTRSSAQDDRRKPYQNTGSTNRRPTQENGTPPRQSTQEDNRPTRQPSQTPQRPAPSRGAPQASRSPTNERPPERAPQGRPAPVEPEPSANVGSMIARMRQMREARERKQGAPPPAASRHADTNVPLRFRAGQHVRCVPYGEGVVQSSEAVDGREQVKVLFPEIGTLTVDPDINFVRIIEPQPGEDGSGDRD